MIRTPTNQRKDLPHNKPLIIDPVFITLDVDLLFFDGENYLHCKKIFCSTLFAETVLVILNEYCVKNSISSLIHLGIYNPRKARLANGIYLNKWSNHAYGNAIDLYGFKKESTINILKWPNLDLLTKQLKNNIKNLELIYEPCWLHIGIEK